MDNFLRTQFTMVIKSFVRVEFCTVLIVFIALFVFVFQTTVPVRWSDSAHVDRSSRSARFSHSSGNQFVGEVYCSRKCRNETTSVTTSATTCSVTGGRVCHGSIYVQRDLNESPGWLNFKLSYTTESLMTVVFYVASIDVIRLHYHTVVVFYVDRHIFKQPKPTPLRRNHWTPYQSKYIHVKSASHPGTQSSRSDFRPQRQQVRQCCLG